MLNQINESCIVGMNFWSGIVIRRGGGGDERIKYFMLWVGGCILIYHHWNSGWRK